MAWGILCLLKKRLNHSKTIRELDFGEGKFVELSTLMDLMTEYKCWEEVEAIKTLCSEHGHGLSHFLNK